MDKGLIEKSLQELGIRKRISSVMLGLTEIGVLSNILFKGMEDKVN